jgi:hypothetical protein
MNRAIVVAVIVCLAAPVYGAVGDLAYKPYGSGPNAEPGVLIIPGQVGDFKAPPDGSGTVSADAKAVTLHRGDLSILMAIDAAKADDKTLNLLRIDAQGTGKFDAAKGLALEFPAAGNRQRATFGPTDIMIVRQGKSIPVRVHGWCQVGPRGPTSMQIFLGSVLEGACDFSGKTHPIRVLDNTSNLKMDDAARPNVRDGTVRGLMQGDFIEVDTGNGSFQKADVRRGYVGQPVLVDGTWFLVTVSADQTKVAAAPLKDPTGQIKVAAPEWTATLASPEQILLVEGGKDAVSVPAGKYVVLGATLRNGDTVATINDPRVGSGRAETVEVVAGKLSTSPWGTPLESKVDAQVQERQVTLKGTLLDAGGRSVPSFMAGNARVGAEWQITGPDGKVIYTAPLGFT